MSKARDKFTYKKDQIYQPSAKRDETRYFACDTEVAYIDVKTESPVSCSSVLCSVFGGDERKDEFGVIHGIVCVCRVVA